MGQEALTTKTEFQLVKMRAGGKGAIKNAKNYEWIAQGVSKRAVQR
jgi:hypothetical protein